MNEVLKRIRIVFKESNKTQTEIGKMLSKTSQYVWKLLNDDSANPSDSVIKDICREFNVNEEWLRTGEGEMYSSSSTDFIEIASKIDIQDPKAKQAILDYWNLSDTDKELFWKFMEKFTKK